METENQNQNQIKPVYIAHFVYVPVSGVGIFGGFRSQEWFKNRIEIFKNYTLKSLLNQTNTAFTIWLSFRPQEINNPLVQELADSMSKLPIKTIMTFDGLMYHDDKFNTSLKDRIWNAGRVVRQCLREGNYKYLFSLKELFENKNTSLVQRIAKSLEGLKTLSDFKHISWVYMTRIDSDDMFRNDVVANIQKMEPWPGAVVCKKGLVYNSANQELAEWNPPTNPPFHTIIFPKDIFFNADYHKQYYRTFRSHEDIVKVFFTKQLPDYSYCVLVHPTEGSHISTIWNHPFQGKKIEDKSVLQNYGIK